MSKSPNYQWLPWKSSPFTLDSQVLRPSWGSLPFEQSHKTAFLNPACFSWPPTKDSTSLATLRAKAAHCSRSFRVEDGARDSSLHNNSSKPLLLHPYRKSPWYLRVTSHLVHYPWLSVPLSSNYLQVKSIKEDYGMRITLLHSDCWNNDAKEKVGGNRVTLYFATLLVPLVQSSL